MVKYFVVTGFGKFRGVNKNASEALVQELQAYLAQRGKGIAGGAQVLVASILTVSASYVDAWLAALMEELPQHLSEEDEVVLLHFGVDDKCRVDLKLEARAYNEATFRVPDEAGWQPIGERIDRDEAHALLETDLPVGSLAGSLRAAGGQAAVSHDAGRFVCNYLLFRSLQRSRVAGPRWHSLFVHVPCVAAANGEAQQLLKFAGVLLDETSLALEASLAAAPALPDADSWSAGQRQLADPDEEVGLGQAGNGLGPAHAPKKAPHGADGGPVPDGSLVAPLHAPAKAKPAKGRGLWAVCSVLLLLLLVRSKYMAGSAGHVLAPVAAQEPLHESV